MASNGKIVQDLIIKRIDRLETKLDYIIPILEGLKVKSTIAGSIAGGIAGLIGTGIVAILVSMFK